MTLTPEVIVARDTAGAGYRLLSPPFGSGGQGDVYRVQGGTFAAKLLHAGVDVTAEDLQARAAAVRRLPLEGLPIAVPLEILHAPRVGYVMELVTGLQPLAYLFPTSEQEKFDDWYYGTGGLRHRLHLLEEVAWLLHRVHSRGLVYGDVSPGNIVAPGPGEDGTVWLIDTDNLHFAGTRPPGRLGTRGFVAPEVQAGGDVSIESDRYALAVLIFQVLTLVHPIGGHRVHGLHTTEVQVRAEGVPWLQRSAIANAGVPWDVVLTKRLLDLTAATFDSHDIPPAARPSAADWSEALIRAAASLLRCESCEATFYAWYDKCSWCGARRPAHVQVHDADLLSHGTEGQESLLGVVQPGGLLQLSGDGSIVPKSRAERPIHFRVRAGAGAEVVWIDCPVGASAERCIVGGERTVISTKRVPVPCAEAGVPREWVQLRYGDRPGRRVAFRASR